MFRTIRQDESTPPGTLEEEIAKAALRLPFEGSDPGLIAAFHRFQARGRIERWKAKRQSVFAHVLTDEPWARKHERYLRSALWKRIRKRTLERDDYRCRRCDGKATEIHHRGYGRLVMAGEDDAQLASLCEGCHRVVEFGPDNSKNSHAEKERILAERDTRRDFPEPKVDLRLRRQKLPTGWDRMNDWQRAGWRKRLQELKAERRAILNARFG